MNERLKQQMEFILEIDKLKSITRQTYIADGTRKENDTEHSWHLAMMVLLLSEHSSEDIDVLRTMAMVLIHDIIEIDAGDTYAYDEKGNETKRARELAAANRIFNILPKDQADYIRGLWDEFEERKTPEARFANSLDKIQPAVLNDASGGKSWNEHEVNLSQILGRNRYTKDGSGALWDYILTRSIMPNVKKDNIRNDYDNIDYERFELAYERIRTINQDNMQMPEEYKSYFLGLADMFNTYYGCYRYVTDNNYNYAAPFYKWYKEIPQAELDKLNKAVNRYRYDTGYYEQSYANPAFAVSQLGRENGQLLSYLASQASLLGPLCFEGRLFELTVFAELYLEIYGIFESEPLDKITGMVKSSIYYFIYDYMEDCNEFKVRDSLGKGNDYIKYIIDNADMSDERSLYLYGENISDNELGTFRYLASLPEEEINLCASTYVNGYIESFRLAGIDLSAKRTVQVRYAVGFGRIVKEAVRLFRENGLEPVFMRNGAGRFGNKMESTGCIDTNPQFAYDHRYDNALYYNKAIKDRQLSTLRQAYEKYAEEAKVYAGPAVIEYFGEEKFDPVLCADACKLDESQEKLVVAAGIEASNLINEFIPHDQYSFTIIAFPLPSIGDRYEEIFGETIKLNTLDSGIYSDIQQSIIRTLDECDHVLIEGMDDNNTRLEISLAEITDRDSQTRFHNCLADCNIPLGEVYTSPKLTGTNGVLNVNRVYINGLQYRNLTLNFRDGLVTDFSCDNYDNEIDNRNYVDDNLIKHHKLLPMGEFAIGTNTQAYVMGKKFDIADKLPILIAEKTGPHIAIGDTCFSMCEDMPVYNPDGKEVIARDNEITLANRRDNPAAAYRGCHTDITIPYNELGKIAAVSEDGKETLIISNGRFVLPGTEELNKVLDND